MNARSTSRLRALSSLGEFWRSPQSWGIRVAAVIAVFALPVLATGPKIKGRVAFRSKRSPGRIAFDLKLPLSATEQNELAEKLIATATAFCEEKFEAKGREP